MSILKTDFGGDRGDLFQLALKTGLLTIITLGLYRFWQTTRLRRWYWSAIRIGNTPLEYTGTAQEKLSGFLMAVIVLAFYLAAFNAVAMFTAIRLTEGAPDYLTWAMAATPLALIPIIFMARYRARRYIMSRTCWRGIRMGMSGGAWGYAWRACLYWTLTILSLGLLWPVMTFRLEKYLTDRSWFGDAQFLQFGGPGMLYGAVAPFLVMLWGCFALVIAAVITGQALYGWGLLLTVPLTLLAAISYRVMSIRLLAGMKTLGNGMEVDIAPHAGRLIRINILGRILTGLVVGVVSPVVLGIVFGLIYLSGTYDPAMLVAPPPTIAAVLAIATWLTVFVLYGTCLHVFVTFPMVKHIGETFELHEPTLLRTVRQRARADGRDAGGFADALDVGAAF
jgi:uncharacterized membrane protein YjgN (DUF898 family)